MHTYSQLPTKASRHSAIADVIRQETPASQEELRKKLARRGFRVAQATLSRDIHELGLVKTSDGYALPAAERRSEAALPALHRLVREFLLEIREAQNLLVLKTSVGSAQPVAAALDAESWPEVVGTVAGDDTILVVSKSRKTAGQLAAKLRGLLS